jgi:DNA-directed RNA polymerase subunit alpha
MPKRVEIDESTQTEQYGHFVAEPLERGFGITLGNALRRVLLSSLQGSAITSVKIDGVQHEFSTVGGVLEDVVDIILNLKGIRFRLLADDSKVVTLSKKGAGEVTAGDIKTDADLEILNPDVKIATLDSDGSIKMELTVDSGRGYIPAEQHRKQNKYPIGTIPIDSLFSPVTKVNFQVENTRVGQRTDYDRLILDIFTDSSISPNEALAFAAKILKDHFLLFIDFEEEPVMEIEEELDEEKERIKKLLNMSIEELELSVRSANCLKTARIGSLGELVQRTEAEMLKYRNFGRKSLSELTSILAEYGIHFGMNVEDYGIKLLVSDAEAEPAEETAKAEETEKSK